MFKTIQIFTCMCITAYWLTGCTSKFTVVDESGMTFSLSKTRLAGAQTIEVLDGEAVRLIPLKQIMKMVLDPATTHYKNSKLYYRASIELIDGTEIKPRINGDVTTKSFVNIDNIIIGKGSSGNVTIPLQNINFITNADVDL